METIGLRVKTLEKKIHFRSPGGAIAAWDFPFAHYIHYSTLDITGCCLRWWIMSKYGNILLAQLKTELRKRKARLSGRKQELIQR